jgi:DNA mismatch endonuclease (patch repair protein)
MSDVFSKQKRSEVMAHIHSCDNKSTEQALLRIFRTHHISGWRRHQLLPGKPDFTFRNIKLVIFVDGCFWHGCPKHGRIPKTNQKYWRAKLDANKARDRKINRELMRKGWHVLRIWEHEMRSPDKIIHKITAALDMIHKK